MINKIINEVLLGLVIYTIISWSILLLTGCAGDAKSVTKKPIDKPVPVSQPVPDKPVKIINLEGQNFHHVTDNDCLVSYSFNNGLYTIKQNKRETISTYAIDDNNILTTIVISDKGTFDCLNNENKFIGKVGKVQLLEIKEGRLFYKEL